MLSYDFFDPSGRAQRIHAASIISDQFSASLALFTDWGTFMKSQSIVAAHRFALGPKPSELALYQANPREALIAQLKSDRSAGLSRSADVLRLGAEIRAARVSENEELGMELQQQQRQFYIRDAIQRTAHGVATDAPFAERLVHFWANHFAVSADKASTVAYVGSFEEEAIRPHIAGSFADMLLASSKHPAMLLYLDNAQSIGPQSLIGRRGDRGLNENLAREILELHTLGVDGGYSQEDVTSFARMITGWSIPLGALAERFRQLQTEGSFVFIEAMHEPGNHKLLGKTYRQPGVEQGEAALRDLALHPSTAEHIATKLARHFIQDQPDAADIKVLSDAYLASDGQLMPLYEALLNLSSAWDPLARKFRTPNDWMLAVLRGMGAPAASRRPNNELQQSLTLLGQAPWRPGSPAGWPDTADRWDSPDALSKRIEWANTLALRVGSTLSASKLASTLFDDQVESGLMRAIESAESNAQALILAMLSPQMMRR